MHLLGQPLSLFLCQMHCSRVISSSARTSPQVAPARNAPVVAGWARTILGIFLMDTGLYFAYHYHHGTKNSNCTVTCHKKAHFSVIHEALASFKNEIGIINSMQFNTHHWREGKTCLKPPHCWNGIIFFCSDIFGVYSCFYNETLCCSLYLPRGKGSLQVPWRPRDISWQHSIFKAHSTRKACITSHTNGRVFKWEL